MFFWSLSNTDTLRLKAAINTDVRDSENEGLTMINIEMTSRSSWSTATMVMSLEGHWKTNIYCTHILLNSFINTLSNIEICDVIKQQINIFHIS